MSKSELGYFLYLERGR